jgi:DNA polymerase-1
MPDDIQIVSDMLNDFVDDKVKGLIEKKEWMEKCSFTMVKTREQFTELIDRLIAKGLCSLDLETTSLNTRKDSSGHSVAKLVGICLAESSFAGWYTPCGHEDKEFNLPYDFTVREIARLIKNCRCIFHHFKYDGQVLFNHDIIITDETMIEDTYLMAGVVDASAKERGLKHLSDKLLGRPMIDINKLMVKSGKHKIVKFDMVPPQIALYYGCSDAMNTFGLYEYFSKELDKQDPDKKGGPWAVYEKIERRCLFPVMMMERTMCRIDAKHLITLKERLEEKRRGVLKSIHSLAGREIEVNSPKQLGILLFEEMKIPYPEKEKTASGQYSTEEGTLQKISDVPIIGLILEFRAISKIIGTYVDNLLNNVDENGFVKFQLNQLQADTGRFSASGGDGLKHDGYCGVNCQNIPNPDEDDEEAPDIRKAIVARPGYKIVSIDYSGEELRIAANLSREPKWLDEFLHGTADLHTMTAKIIYAKAEVVKKERKTGKTINFLTMYGGGAGGFAAQAKIPYEMAKKMIINFFRGYPVLKRWIDSEIKAGRKRGYSRTSFGRRRPLTEFYAATDEKIKAKGDRCAVNSCIQGTGADVIKIALFRVWKWMKDNGYGDDVHMLMPIHDEIVFEIKEDKLDFYVPELCEILKIRDLTDALGWPIPFDVDAEYGDSFHVDHNYWEERKKAGQAAVVPAPIRGQPVLTAVLDDAQGYSAPPPTPTETTPNVTTTTPEPKKEAAGDPPKESVLRVDTSTAVLETPPSNQEAHTTSSGEFIHFTVTVREAVMAAAEKAKLKFEQSESEAYDEALKDVRIKDRIDQRGVLVYPIERLDHVTLHQFDTAIRILVNYGAALFVGPCCKVALVDKSTGEVWYESTKKVSVDAFLALCFWLKI